MYDTAGRDRNVEDLFSSGRQRSDRVIMDLLRYWESLRDGRIAPARSEIDPRQIKSALKHTFILEFDPIGGIRFRLAGEKVCALLGMELRGMPAYTLIDPSDRAEFDRTLQAMTRSPEIIEYRLSGSGGEQFTANARMLLLPMQDADGNIARVLGGLSMRTPLFDPPMRFELIEKMRTRIVASARHVSQASDSGFAEEASPFAPQEQSGNPTPGEAGQMPDRGAGPGAPFLRVITDNYGQPRE